MSRLDLSVGHIPVSVAAVMLGVSTQRVYKLLEKSTISGVKIGKTWLVNQRSVEARIALLKQEGRRNGYDW